MSLDLTDVYDGGKIERGTVERGYLEVADLPTGIDETIPAIVAEGVEDGPTLWLTGAIHGNEATGMAVCQDVVHEGLAEELEGRVVSLPNLNPAGLRRNTRESYYDGDDPNRKFPDVDYATADDPDPTEPITTEDDLDEEGRLRGVRKPGLQEVICRKLYDLFDEEGTTVFDESVDDPNRADALLDVHTAQVNSYPFVIKDRVLYDGEFGRTEDDAQVLADELEEMADTFGLPVMFEYVPKEYIEENFHRSTAGAALNMAEIPAMTIELGSYDVVEDDRLAAGVRGVYRVMEHKGMIDHPADVLPDGVEWKSDEEEVEDPTEEELQCDEVRRHRGPYAPEAGIVRHEVAAGEDVEKGEVVARIVPPNGDPTDVEEVTADYPGWIIQRDAGIAKYQNDSVTMMAVEDDGDPIHTWEYEA